MSSRFTIRAVRPLTDAADVLRVLHAAHAWNLANGFNFTAADISLDALAPRLDPTTVWVAEAPDGALRGTIEVKPDTQAHASPGDWVFHMLAVDPTASGSGLGRRLVAHAEHLARAAGATRLTLDTPETHPWLPAFYARLGYAPFGHAQWEGKRYRSVLMAKRL